jgi:hypothetical protein
MNPNGELKSPLPAIPRDHIAYLHDLICQAIIIGIPFMILISEPEPLTINLLSWVTLETTCSSDRDDQLMIISATGVEILLTINQTAELKEKLEVMLGKKPPLLTVPNLILKSTGN